MEIALILVLLFVAIIYFSVGRRNTPLHKTFSALLIITPPNLAVNAATVYTVNHLKPVSPLLTEILHRLFIGTMVVVVIFFTGIFPFWLMSIKISDDERSIQKNKFIIAVVVLVLVFVVNYILLNNTINDNLYFRYVHNHSVEYFGKKIGNTHSRLRFGVLFSQKYCILIPL